MKHDNAHARGKGDISAGPMGENKELSGECEHAAISPAAASAGYDAMGSIAEHTKSVPHEIKGGRHNTKANLRP